MEFTSAAFWAALGSIIWVNIILSGDNAVVIALAARTLPPSQQKQAIFWGSAAAIVMRVVLTIIAVEMLKWPYLKIIGALLLVYIGVTLMLEDADEGGDGGHEAAGLWVAIRTILIADLVMSLDNVIAVAAAAKDSYLLLILGLAISVPLVVFGATLLLRVMQRFPVIITVGAGLLGWVAGEMATSDPVAKGWIDAHADWLHAGAAAIGAAFVVALGSWLGRRALARIEQRAVDLAAPEVGRSAPGGTNR